MTEPTPVKVKHDNPGRPRKSSDPQPRTPGARAAWRRVRDNPGSWHNLVALGLNESLGTHLSLLFAENRLTEAQADAGRNFAMLAGKYDRHYAIVHRGMRSPAYEAGYGGRSDEVALAERQGAVKEYERNAKKIKKRYMDACAALGMDIIETVSGIYRVAQERRLFDLIERVCVMDQYCPAAEIPMLRAGLEFLAKHWNIRPDDHGKIVSSHAPGARLGSKGRK